MADKSVEFIEWRDSLRSGSDWDLLSNIRKRSNLCLCHSFGYVWDEDDDHLLIVPHIVLETDTVSGQGSGQLTIPKASITRRIPLQVTSMDCNVLMGQMVAQLKEAEFRRTNPNDALKSCLKTLANHRELTKDLSDLMVGLNGRSEIDAQSLLDIIDKFNDRQKLVRQDTTHVPRIIDQEKK